MKNFREKNQKGMKGTTIFLIAMTALFSMPIPAFAGDPIIKTAPQQAASTLATTQTKAPVAATPAVTANNGFTAQTLTPVRPAGPVASGREMTSMEFHEPRYRPGGIQEVRGTILVLIEASSDIAKVDYRMGENGPVFGASSEALNLFPVQLNTNDGHYPDGDYIIYARGYSAAGQQISETKVEIRIKNSGSQQDTTRPTLAISFPRPDATVRGRSETAVRATDNVGVTKVAYQLERLSPSTGNPNIYSLGTSTQSPFGLVWDTTQIPDGSYTLRATAYDAAGNSADDKVVIKILNHPSGGLTTSQTQVRPASGVQTRSLQAPAVRVLSKTARAAMLRVSNEEAVKVKISFGTSQNSLTQSVVDNNLATVHEMKMQPLLPSTTYYYKVEVTNKEGKTASYGPSKFETPSFKPVLTEIARGTKSVTLFVSAPGILSTDKVVVKLDGISGEYPMDCPAGGRCKVKIDGLKKGTPYKGTVTAKDSSGKAFGTALDIKFTTAVPQITVSYPQVTSRALEAVVTYAEDNLSKSGRTITYKIKRGTTVLKEGTAITNQQGRASIAATGLSLVSGVGYILEVTEKESGETTSVKFKLG